jgi:predicted dienelactone hydrolase
MRISLIVSLLTLFAWEAGAQTNRIDVIRPDAPELASFGPHAIGVRTLQFTDFGRPDILNTPRGGETSYYDRPLDVEIWYPAQSNSAHASGTQYLTETRNPEITATLTGSATRDAVIHADGGPFPLVIISHGYPGNRYLLSHLGENLASKAYVVVSIDHRDSTYTDQQAFASTLFNRPLDQRFILQQIAGQSQRADSFLYQRVDAERTAIVGYSMGGYGLLNNLGGAYSEAMVNNPIAPPNGLLRQHSSGNPDFRAQLDPRIKAGVAIAPWGMNSGFWREGDLAGITLPTLYIAGSADSVAGYENGSLAIFKGARNSDRHLLTFINAGHNAGAPIPLPVELQNSANPTGSSHYTDPVWDSTRMNNIMDHFITAYLDVHLQERSEQLAYLDLVPESGDGVFSMVNGVAGPEHSYWKGFERGTAVGLRMEHLAIGQ